MRGRRDQPAGPCFQPADFDRQRHRRGAAVKLRELRIGQFSVTDVPAVVHENLHVSLLGQTFLKRLDSYEMRDGVLTLNWN